jgi:hypothetical protein
MTSSQFIGESVDVVFDRRPPLTKKPVCPDGFLWRGREYRVIELISQWRDFDRKGRMSRNMRPNNAATARERGSWGVGRYFFRVRMEEGRVFELYYDRAPKNASKRIGGWFLYRELSDNE